VSHMCAGAAIVVGPLQYGLLAKDEAIRRWRRSSVGESPDVVTASGGRSNVATDGHVSPGAKPAIASFALEEALEGAGSCSAAPL
jgi:hypothetical protein